MTYAYSSTKNGWRDQIKKQIKKREAQGNKIFVSFNDMLGAINLMVDQLAIIMPVKLPAAHRAMTMIQQYTMKAITGNDNINWISPVGFPMMMRYKKTNSRKINMKFNRKAINISMYSKSDVTNAGKLENAVAPNFIHCVDSSHLLMIVDAMSEHMIADFIFVHDSFGSHANDLELLYKVTRETFVKLHSGNLLLDFLKHILDASGNDYDLDKLIEDTKQGGFNLLEVLSSKYSYN